MTNARELWDRRPLDVIWEWGEAEFAGNSKARLTKKNTNSPSSKSPNYHTIYARFFCSLLWFLPNASKIKTAGKNL